MSGQHSAKGTKQHSILRSVKNKRTGKYDRQRRRTEERKARVELGDTCKLRRIAKRREQDAAADKAGHITPAIGNRQEKRATRARLRKMNTKDRQLAREKGQRQFHKIKLGEGA